LVQDTGYGIPEAAKTRLFEKFYQATGGKAPLQPVLASGYISFDILLQHIKARRPAKRRRNRHPLFVSICKKEKAHLAHETIWRKRKKEAVILDELLEEPEEEAPAVDLKESNPGILVTDGIVC
jgi:hypothetical protein